MLMFLSVSFCHTSLSFYHSRRGLGAGAGSGAAGLRAGGRRDGGGLERRRSGERNHGANRTGSQLTLMIPYIYLLNGQNIDLQTTSSQYVLESCKTDYEYQMKIHGVVKKLNSHFF